MKKTVPFTLSDAQRWREQYPTPFYVYDAAAIKQCAEDLNRAFSWNSGFREYFAVKALPNPAILRILRECGCGADCASEAELLLARKSGMEQIIFSANEVTTREYEAALNAGAIVNFDDITQIAQLEKVASVPETVCCRYNPGKFRITNEIMGRLYDSKFGMTKAQLFEALSILRDKGAKRLGVHAMLASCSLDEAYYPALAKTLFALTLEIREKTGITLSFLDLSGGMGIPYRPEENPVDIFAVGDGVRRAYEEILTPAGIELALYTEMGRYVTGPYGYLVTTVIGEKHIYKDYVGVDATACNLMRPAMYGSYHHIVALGKEEAPCDTVVDVVGSLCENNDKFAVDRALPSVTDGDMLVILDAGAHGYSMGYNYNGKLHCAELLLEDGEVRCIRRAETLRDYFATLDIDPAFQEGSV